MLKIYPVETGKDKKTAETLFAELNYFLRTKLPQYKDLPPRKRGPIFTLIANYKGMDVGCIGLRKESDEVCEMLMLYVKNKFRCKGIGRALAEAIIKHARQMCYHYMRLDTYEPLDPAMKLYTSLGFKKIGTYHEFPAEIKELAVCMELALV